MGFDLPNTFVTVLEHGFVPGRVQHAGPGFQCDLL